MGGMKHEKTGLHTHYSDEVRANTARYTSEHRNTNVTINGC